MLVAVLELLDIRCLMLYGDSSAFYAFLGGN